MTKSTKKSPPVVTPNAKQPAPKSAAIKTAKDKSPSKLDRLEQMLCREKGATIAEMAQSTGWLDHSVRGAMAGVLKKRGLMITSNKISGVRRYNAARSV